jgi:hypothetical protein
MSVEWIVGSEEVREWLIVGFGTVAEYTVDSSFTPCFL